MKYNVHVYVIQTLIYVINIKIKKNEFIDIIYLCIVHPVYVL